MLRNISTPNLPLGRQNLSRDHQRGSSRQGKSSRQGSRQGSRRGQLPPLYSQMNFFPPESPLHDAYNSLLVTASRVSSRSGSRGHSRGSFVGSRPNSRALDSSGLAAVRSTSSRQAIENVWNDIMGKPPSRSKKLTPQDNNNIAPIINMFNDSGTRDHVESLHFSKNMLKRATSAASSSLLSAGQDDFGILPAKRTISTAHHFHIMQANQELLRVLSDVQQASICFQEIVKEVGYHRSNLARILGKLQVTFVQLFEQMLSVMLQYTIMQEEATSKQAAMKTEISTGMEEEAMKLSRELAKAQRLITVHESKAKTDEQRIQGLELEIERLQQILHDESEALQDDAEQRQQLLLARSDYKDLFDELGEKEDESKRMDIDKKARAAAKRAQLQEESANAFQLQVQRSVSDMKSLVNEVENNEVKQNILLRQMEEMVNLQLDVRDYNEGDRDAEIRAMVKAELEAKYKKKIRDLNNSIEAMERAESHRRASTNRGINVNQTTSCTQTLVDEDCLWDEEECDIISVSGPALEKIMREKIMAISKCPHCCRTYKIDDEGRPVEISKVEKKMERGRKKRKTRIKQQTMLSSKVVYVLPDSLRHFLSNLPKSIQATDPPELLWISREISKVYYDKLFADKDDLADGMALQKLETFLIELLLQRHGLRRLAELQMYEIVQGVKQHYKKNAKVKMFGRFLGMCVTATKGGESIGKSLGLDVLSVYLYLRRRLLTPPVYIPKIPKDLQLRPKQEVNGSLSKVEQQIADDKWAQIVAAHKKKIEMREAALAKRKKLSLLKEEELLGEGSHVTTEVDGVGTFVPLGHAVYELKRLVLTFMSAKKLDKFCRDVEKQSKIVDGQGVVQKLPIGSNGDIRVVMRQAMIASPEEQAKYLEELNDGASGKAKAGTIVTSVDAVLSVLVETLLIRRNQVEENLKRLFSAGDENGDGVLSFDEFLNIIKARFPQTSKRRALRMFRDALTRGEDNSSAISRESFVETCRDNGLAQLVDTDALDKKELGLDSLNSGNNTPADGKKSTSTDDYLFDPEVSLHLAAEQELQRLAMQRRVIESEIRAEWRAKRRTQTKKIEDPISLVEEDSESKRANREEEAERKLHTLAEQ
eukprot:g3011.t1